MQHRVMNTKKNFLSLIALLFICLLAALSLYTLNGCSSSSSDASSSESNQSEQSADSGTFKINTDHYAIELPEKWADYADVEYDSEGNAQVVYKNNSSIVLLTCSLGKTDDESTSGDIGNGMVYSTDLNDGKRLDVWAPNYIYLFWADATKVQGAESYASLTDDEKEAIIKLTSGQKIKMKKLAKVKTEEKLVNKYNIPYEYLGSLLSDNTTVK